MYVCCRVNEEEREKRGLRGGKKILRYLLFLLLLLNGVGGWREARDKEALETVKGLVTESNLHIHTYIQRLLTTRCFGASDLERAYVHAPCCKSICTILVPINFSFFLSFLFLSYFIFLF